MLAKQTDTATGLRRHTHAARSCKQSAVLRPDSTSYIIASIHTAESSEGCHLPVVLSPKQRRGVSVVSGLTAWLPWPLVLGAFWRPVLKSTHSTAELCTASIMICLNCAHISRLRLPVNARPVRGCVLTAEIMLPTCTARTRPGMGSGRGRQTCTASRTGQCHSSMVSADCSCSRQICNNFHFSHRGWLHNNSTSLTRSN